LTPAAIFDSLGPALKLIHLLKFAAAAESELAMTRKNARSDTKRGPRKARGMAAQVLDAPRSVWDAGVSMLSRGSKMVASPGTGAFTESLQGGLKKLEEVFDQRVLDSLSRASMPTPSELRKLSERVESLEKLVSRLKRRGGKI
jgi:Poly(hydroxyalcanoate) granule associated protein (phasin)